MRRFSEWIADAPDWQWNLFTILVLALELTVLTALARLGLI